MTLGSFENFGDFWEREHLGAGDVAVVRAGARLNRRRLAVVTGVGLGLKRCAIKHIWVKY